MTTLLLFANFFPLLYHIQSRDRVMDCFESEKGFSKIAVKSNDSSFLIIPFKICYQIHNIYFSSTLSISFKYFSQSFPRQFLFHTNNHPSVSRQTERAVVVYLAD